MTDAAKDVTTPFYKSGTFWLVVATVAYLAAILLVVGKRGQCGGADVPIFFEGLRGLHHYYLSCRPLNVLGDFLAGVFAPLALIWLAAAVFIQSRELAAQRQELTLARDEARQTREVLQQQADESRSTAAYIGKQTKILEIEHARKDEELKVARLRELVDYFKTRVFVKGGFYIEGTKTNQQGISSAFSLPLADDSLLHDESHAFVTLQLVARTYREELEKMHAEQSVRIKRVALEDIEQAHKGAAHIARMAAKIPVAAAAWPALLQAGKLAEELKKLLECCQMFETED